MAGENGNGNGRPDGMSQEQFDQLVAEQQRLRALPIPEKKALFLENYEEGIHSMQAAALAAGTTRTTIWRWRRTDPEFDRAVTALTSIVDVQRTLQVEEMLYKRITDGEASTGEIVFWLCNRAPKRWKDVREVNHNHSVAKYEVRAFFVAVGAFVKDIVPVSQHGDVEREFERVAKHMGLIPAGASFGDLAAEA